MEFKMILLNKYLQNKWAIANPTILYRAVRGFFRALVLRKNTLRLIELYPTFECQLKCIMCSVLKYEKKHLKKLDIPDYRLIAQGAGKLGAWCVTVLGGEPLLYNKIFDLISVFHKERYFTHIVSNGQAASEEVIRELKKAGLNALYFSLESIDPSENDRIRGSGTHEKAISGYEYAKKAGLITGLCPTMFPGELDKAEKVIQFCHEHGINSSGGQIAPIGCAEGFETLSDKEYSRVRDMLKQYPRLTYDWAFSYFLKQRCPSGKEKIGITCYGDVIGCSYNPLCFGNITSESLKKIWERMGRFSQFAKDFPGCLSAEDQYYIKNYLIPIYEKCSYPVFYSNHPFITKETEPLLFK
ncbi:radical SAM protein [bacterium]|nr:radical SAM protein [bacterium]